MLKYVKRGVKNKIINFAVQNHTTFYMLRLLAQSQNQL